MPLPPPTWNLILFSWDLKESASSRGTEWSSKRRRRQRVLPGEITGESWQTGKPFQNDNMCPPNHSPYWQPGESDCTKSFDVFRRQMCRGSKSIIQLVSVLMNFTQNTNRNRFSPSNWLQLEWNAEISLEAKFFFYAMDENWYCDIATYYVVLHWYSIEYRWIWLGNWQNTGAGPGKIVKNWVSLGAKHMMTFVMVDGHCWDSIFQNINFYELFFVENYFAGLKW